MATEMAQFVDFIGRQGRPAPPWEKERPGGTPGVRGELKRLPIDCLDAVSQIELKEAPSQPGACIASYTQPDPPEAPRAGVEIGTWFDCPAHPTETPVDKSGYHEGMCPAAEHACREVIHLPTHPRTGERTACRGVELLDQIGPPPRPGAEAAR